MNTNTDFPTKKYKFMRWLLSCLYLSIFFGIMFMLAFLADQGSFKYVLARTEVYYGEIVYVYQNVRVVKIDFKGEILSFQVNQEQYRKLLELYYQEKPVAIWYAPGRLLEGVVEFDGMNYQERASYIKTLRAFLYSVTVSIYLGLVVVSAFVSGVVSVKKKKK